MIRIGGAGGNGNRANRKDWTVLTDETQAEMIANKRAQRMAIAREWSEFSAERDVEELRHEQARWAVIYQANVSDIPLTQLKRRAVDNIDFEGAVVYSLIQSVYFSPERCEKGHTGLFEHLSREEATAYFTAALQQLIEEQQ